MHKLFNSSRYQHNIVGKDTFDNQDSGTVWGDFLGEIFQLAMGKIRTLIKAVLQAHC